jgi:hypothetical protein
MVTLKLVDDDLYYDIWRWTGVVIASLNILVSGLKLAVLDMGYGFQLNKDSDLNGLREWIPYEFDVYFDAFKVFNWSIAIVFYVFKNEFYTMFDFL